MWGNDSTADALVRSLSNRAAPLILDEADDRRAEDMMSLLRHTSATFGSRQVRGACAGRARRGRFMSPAILGTVLAPPLLPQDASRITKMELVTRPTGAPPLPTDTMLAWAREHAAALWGRAIAGIPRFRANLAAVRADLLGRRCWSRLADQVGTIVAARAMMLADEPLSASAVGTHVSAVGWLLQPRECPPGDLPADPCGSPVTSADSPW